MSDIYKTPESELNKQLPVGNYGSLEKGIAGDYEFSIGGTISEAWEKTSGAKGTMMLAGFLYLVVMMAVSFGMQFLMMAVFPTDNNSSQGVIIGSVLVQQIILNLIVMPMAMGLFIIGLRRSVNAPISVSSIFDYFPKAVTLLLTMLLFYIMVIIGLVLLVVPGIYLMVAYFMAMPLVVEKGLSPWQALEASRKAVSKHWFGFLGFYIAMLIIMLVSMLPLGIGLFWTMPMFLIAWGIMYRNMFGCEAKTVA